MERSIMPFGDGKCESRRCQSGFAYHISRIPLALLKQTSKWAEHLSAFSILRTLFIPIYSKPLVHLLHRLFACSFLHWQCNLLIYFTETKWSYANYMVSTALTSGKFCTGRLPQRCYLFYCPHPACFTHNNSNHKIKEVARKFQEYAVHHFDTTDEIVVKLHQQCAGVMETQPSSVEPGVKPDHQWWFTFYTFVQMELNRFI